jgi:glyceraldehyde 3-phosphate dehydrogenase
MKVAINGYGRIGRNILRALYESQHYRTNMQIVAVNDMGDAKTLAHLTQYDSVHGKFNFPVEAGERELRIAGDTIQVSSERDPSKLPWESLGVELVFECTGHFASRDKASAHLAAGAKKVLISAPAGTDIDATIVYGINHNTLKKTDQIISNASCTTNCLVPLVKPLHAAVGLESGLMTTIHAYTNDQVLIDGYHTDLHRARSATQSMIPTKTGAASAVGLVMPELKGKLDGFALRVPVINVSVVDLTFIAKRSTTVAEVNAIVKKAAETELKNILTVNDLPLVSIDFNHNPASSIFDSTQTKVIGNLVKVLAWYDNEWGFSNRMLDTGLYWGRL